MVLNFWRPNMYKLIWSSYFIHSFLTVNLNKYMVLNATEKPLMANIT